MFSLLKKRKRLTECEVQCYIFQLIQGLKYLHRNRIIHRDLKPSNLFLNNNMELKIGDFGLIAQVSKDNGRRTTRCGTQNYMAPEIFENDDKGYLFEVDIWSMGVIMYELLTGEHPFNGGSKNEIENNIININYNRDNQYLSEEAKDLIEQIFVKDPKRRPGLIQILYHDFFHKYAFPEFFDISTFEKAPILAKRIQFEKDERTSELYKLIVNDIPEIQYNDIDSYSLKNLQSSKNELEYLTYFHKSQQGFYYYLTCKELVGILFEKEEKEEENDESYSLCFLLDQRNNMIYWIKIYVNEDQKKDKINLINQNNCPENLKDKLNIFLDYNIKILDQKQLFNKKNSFSQQSDIYLDSSSEGKNSIYSQQSIEINIKLLYIRYILKEKLANFIYLSDNTRQIIFDDKSQIIVSEKDEKVGIIDKSNNLTIISLQNIFNNPNTKLVKKIKYIRRTQFNVIKKKMLKKLNEGK